MLLQAQSEPLKRFMLSSFGWCRDDVHELAKPAAVTKFNRARDSSKQSIVLAQPDILARLVACSTLPDDDGATRHNLAGENLDAQSLGIRIAAVLRTS